MRESRCLALSPPPLLFSAHTLSHRTETSCTGICPGSIHIPTPIHIPLPYRQLPLGHCSGLEASTRVEGSVPRRMYLENRVAQKEWKLSGEEGLLWLGRSYWPCGLLTTWRGAARGGHRGPLKGVLQGRGKNKQEAERLVNVTLQDLMRHLPHSELWAVLGKNCPGRTCLCPVLGGVQTEPTA